MQTEAKPLVELIQRKTEGNPFFVSQFLQTMYQDGLIVFDRLARRWQWDLQHIRAANVTDNVVDLMASQITRLPSATQEILKLAACLGNSFTLEDLALIADKAPNHITEQLRPALERDLVLPLIGAIAPLRVHAYQWSHDRVHQAAYSLIPISQLPRMHLDIGRSLLSAITDEQLVERLFHVVNH